MKRMTEKVLIKTDPALKNRLYQVESLMNILNLESEKCLVKMFCGTGKSRIITNVIIHEKKTWHVVHKQDGITFAVCELRPGVVGGMVERFYI